MPISWQARHSLQLWSRIFSKINAGDFSYLVSLVFPFSPESFYSGFRFDTIQWQPSIWLHLLRCIYKAALKTGFLGDIWWTQFYFNGNHGHYTETANYDAPSIHTAGRR